MQATSRSCGLVIFTVRNEVAKVMFSQACVCPQGGEAGPGGTWCSGGDSGPGWCLLLGGGCLVLGGSWSSGGCLVGGSGGAWYWGVGIPACTEADPPERRLLLRTVRILLECILVLANFGGSEGEGVSGMCAPGLISFSFMQFLAKRLPNNRLTPHLWSWHLGLGHTGSATGNCLLYLCVYLKDVTVFIFSEIHVFCQSEGATSPGRVGGH